MMRIISDNLEELIAAALLSIIGVVMLLQVGLRTVVGAPLSWPEELSQFLFVWASAFGAIGAAKRSGLVRVETVTELLPPVVRTGIKYLILLLTFVLLGVLGSQGWRFASRTSFTAASLPITWAWAYYAAPVFSAIVATRLIQLQLFGYRFLFIEKILKKEHLNQAPDGIVV
jgi:TRAP-type C4-dicarboxylate transport system permease small subunit